MTGNWRWAGTAGAFSLVLLTGVLLGPPSATAAARASSASATTVLSSDPRIGFVGRWERHYSGNEAATVNSGSQIRLTFTGRQLTGLFDISPVRMAFFGDSITEGIRALGQPLTPDGADGTRTYASVACRAFHADIQLVGFGKQGVMRDGDGNVGERFDTGSSAAPDPCRKASLTCSNSTRSRPSTAMTPQRMAWIEGRCLAMARCVEQDGTSPPIGSSRHEGTAGTEHLEDHRLW